MQTAKTRPWDKQKQIAHNVFDHGIKVDAVPAQADDIRHDGAKRDQIDMCQNIAQALVIPRNCLIQYQLSLYFSDEQNGKLLVVHEEQLDYQLLLFETHDGGRTWSRVQSDTLPVSHGGAKQARPFAAIGFVSDLIGFASIEYRAEIEPETRTYLTFDGGKTWEKWNYQTTKDEMPEGYGDTVALSCKDSVLYLTVSVQGGNLENPYYLAYKSTDNGASWQPCQ